MSIKDTIKKTVLEGFSNADIPTLQIVITLGITFIIALYIYFIYRLVSKSALYDRNFHTSMAIISVITAGIIIAMQSSIVISLGMVGALSIVRFRTAIKNPMDLLFLFWSIGVGIICGAGLFEIAFVVSLMVTVGIFLLEFVPEFKKPYLLSKKFNKAFNDAIIGVEITIPSIPKKCPNTSNPIIIVTGCSFIVLPIIRGCSNNPSICCDTKAITIAKTPTIGLTVNPTIAAIAPPIQGPI